MRLHIFDAERLKKGGAVLKKRGAVRSSFSKQYSLKNTAYILMILEVYSIPHGKGFASDRA